MTEKVGEIYADGRRHMSAEEHKQVLLELLKDFSAFCDRHELAYYLDAGTLIGAVRHKGFIPWDDDIDLNMPQIDYDRFIEIVERRGGMINDHVIVEFPKDTIYPYLKISDTRTILIEFPDKNPMEVGVYLDLFPKYGIVDKSWRSKAICKISEFLGLVHWFNKYSVNAWRRRDIIHRTIAVVARTLTWSDAWGVRLQDKLMHNYARRHPLETCSFVTTLTNGEFHKLAPKECFAGFQWLEFEGLKFKGPVDFDTYLRCLYPGDYMQLPPEDKRYHHNIEVYWKR